MRALGRKSPEATIQAAKQDYRTAKKELNTMIKREKHQKWKELCGELEQNVWGTAYQILTKRLGVRHAGQLDASTVHDQYRKLFPSLPETGCRMEPPLQRDEMDDAFTDEELACALKQVKAKKAPGMDKITNDMLAACVESDPKSFLDVFNACLRRGEFPEIWREAKLVLVEKPTKPGKEQSYRPLCLLNTTGKLLERLINKRLMDQLEAAGALSEYQYAYRKGRGTVDAIMAMMTRVTELRKTSLTHRRLCVMVLIDIKNAFNSVPWNGVRGALERAGITKAIRRMISTYLSSRRVVLPDGETRLMSCGVPQGSVVGGTLWNAFYDSVLTLPQETGVTALGYADDLALIVEGATKEELKDKAEYAIGKVIYQLKKMGLTIEETKSEVVILEGRRKMPEITINVGNTTVASSRSAKYLGVHLDKDLRMTTHIKRCVERAAAVQNRLSRLMPNIGGPSHKRRRILATVVSSVVLYAAPVWEPALKYKTNVQTLRRIERKYTIAVTSAYRTASTDAVGALAGCPPLDLLAWERARNWEERGEKSGATRSMMMEKWQRRWEAYRGWAAVFVRDVRDWRERAPPTNFYATQAITGHGCFGTYLKEIGKMDSDLCWFGCGKADSPEHTVFECAKFAEHRRKVESRVGADITPQSVAEILVGARDKAESVVEFLTDIMKIKMEYERMSQAERPE